MLTFYELDLGLNHVVRKYSEPLEDTANMLIPGEEGLPLVVAPPTACVLTVYALTMLLHYMHSSTIYVDFMRLSRNDNIIAI